MGSQAPSAKRGRLIHKNLQMSHLQPFLRLFLFRCLVKDFEQRPLVCELLSHPFIKQVNFYADEVRPC